MISPFYFREVKRIYFDEITLTTEGLERPRYVLIIVATDVLVLQQTSRIESDDQMLISIGSVMNKIF